MRSDRALWEKLLAPKNQTQEIRSPSFLARGVPGHDVWSQTGSRQVEGYRR